MLTFKAANYKRNDLRIMLETIQQALDSLECSHTCENCPNYRVCGDFTRLQAFVASKYNSALAKRER